MFRGFFFSARQLWVTFGASFAAPSSTHWNNGIWRSLRQGSVKVFHLLGLHPYREALLCLALLSEALVVWSILSLFSVSLVHRQWEKVSAGWMFVEKYSSIITIPIFQMSKLRRWEIKVCPTLQPINDTHSLYSFLKQLLRTYSDKSKKTKTKLTFQGAIHYVIYLTFTPCLTLFKSLHIY